MACDDRQLTEAQRVAGYQNQRTGVQRALRPFSGRPTLDNLIDYINREVTPAIRQTRDAVNDVYLQVADNAPSGNPLAYYFSTETAAADPTVGRIRLDASPQNTATTIRISQTNARLVDVAPWLDVMAGSSTTPLGVVTLSDAINPGRAIRFDLSTMVDQGDYWDLGVSVIEATHPDPFVEGEAVVLAFIPGVASTGTTVPPGALTPIAAQSVLGNPTSAVAAPVAIALNDLSVLGRAGVLGTDVAGIDVPGTGTFTGESVFLRVAQTRLGIQWRPWTLIDMPEMLNNKFVGNVSGATARPAYTDIVQLAQDLFGIGFDPTTHNFRLSDRGPLSVIGRSANSTGAPGDISAAAGSDAVLRESGSTLGFGTIATSGLADDSVTNAKLADMAANTVKANATSATASPTDFAVSTNTVLGRVAGDIVSAQLVNAQITDATIANAKLANMAQSTIKGRAEGAGTGAPQDLTPTQVAAVIDGEAITWSALQSFNGGMAAANLQTETVTGTVDITLAASTVRLFLSSTGDFTLNSITGATTGGRLLFVDHVRASGAGNGTVAHASGAAGTQLLCPDSVPLTLANRHGMVLVARDSSWRVIATSASRSPTLVEFEETGAGPFNDYAIGQARHIMCSNAAGVFTGATQGYAGDLLVFSHQGTGYTELQHSAAGSVATNRFFNGRVGKNLRIFDNEIAVYRALDITAGATTQVRWELVSPSFPFAQADDNANGDVIVHNGTNYVPVAGFQHTAQINLTPTGAVGVVDISALPSGGAVTLQPSADFNIDGFTAKSDGYWFDLIYRDTTAFVGTLNENAGAATTSIRNPGNAAITFTTQEAMRLGYRANRWRIIGRSTRGFSLIDGDKGHIVVSGSGTSWLWDSTVAVTGAQVISTTADLTLTVGEDFSVTAQNDVVINAGDTAGGVAIHAGLTPVTGANNNRVTITADDQVVLEPTGSLRVFTAGVERLEVEADGAWQLSGNAGTSGLTIVNAGDAAPPAWGQVPTAGIANNAVTDAKLRDSSALSVIGRSVNSVGDPTDIATTSGSNGVLVESAGVLAWGLITTNNILDNTIANADLRQSAALSVVGRTFNTIGNVADISATAGTDFVLRESGSTISFGQIATAGIANDAVTDGKLRNGGALSVIGRSANSTGDVADIAGTASSDQVLRISGTTLGFGTIATAGIADNAVTNAKIRDSAALSVIGRSANSTGDPADIAAANDGEVLRRSGTALGFGTIATAGITDAAVTLAKMANLAQSSIIGRAESAGTGVPQALTSTQVAAIIDGEPITWSSTHAFNGTNLTANTASDITLTSGGTTTLAATTRVQITSPTRLASSLAFDSVGTTATTAANDLAINSVNVVRFTGPVDPLTGMVPVVDGQTVLLVNAHASTNMGVHIESASSSAANRFAGVGTSRVIRPGEMALAWYDGTSDRWRLLCRDEIDL